MKRLDLILNGKGGVGKSFFAVNFVQFLKDKDIAHLAIDSDNENSTLKRFHPETLFLDLDNRRELDSIFAAVEKANLVVMDCLEEAGAAVVFLPAYSPDLNPIELMWSKVKQFLRRAEARTWDALVAAIAAALASVTAHDAANWFAHCGYSFI